MTLSPARRRSPTRAALGLAATIVPWQLAPELTPLIVAPVLAYALHLAVEWHVSRRACLASRLLLG